MKTFLLVLRDQGHTHFILADVKNFAEYYRVFMKMTGYVSKSFIKFLRVCMDDKGCPNFMEFARQDYESRCKNYEQPMLQNDVKICQLLRKWMKDRELVK